MQADEIRARFDKLERFEVTYPDSIREEVSPNLVRHVIDDEKDGMVIYAKLTDDNADQVIQEQIDFYKNKGYSFEWKYFEHDTPLDLKARLIAHGFEEGEIEALCILVIEDAPANLLEPVDTTKYDIRRITSPDLIEDVIGLQEVVWDEEMPFLRSRIPFLLEHNPDHISVYVAYVDEVAVCSAWITFSANGEFCSLWGGSTLPEYRKRGIYSAILAIRLQEAKARRFKFLTIEASPMSRPIVEKNGFLNVGITYPMTWSPEE